MSALAQISTKTMIVSGGGAPSIAQPDHPFATSAARTHVLAARETLFDQGERAVEIHQIVRGAVMVSRQLPGNRRQILDIAGPGRFVGLTPAERHDCTAVALANSVVYSLDRRAVDNKPAHGEQLSVAMAAEILRLRELATMLGRKTAIERLATFLVEMVGRSKTSSCDIWLPLSRQEIADYLGLTNETVSRNFTALKRRGVIETFGQSEVRIVRLDILKIIAAGKDDQSVS